MFNITKIGVTKVENPDGATTLWGIASVLDSREQEVRIRWTLSTSGEEYDIEAALDFDADGFTLCLNDQFADPDDDLGYVPFDWDLSQRRHIPVPDSTVFFTEEDYEVLEKALNDYAFGLLDRAEEAASDAFLAVIDKEKISD